MRHCNKHWQTQFNRQVFVANWAGVGGIQADFLSLTGALDFSDFVRDVKITMLGPAPFDRHSLAPV